MTKQHMLPAAILALLASCGGNGTAPGSQSADDAQETPKKSGKNMVEKSFFVGSQFSFITNLSSVNIVYTQGDYSVTAKADSAMLKYLDLQFDSNLLTVNLGHDNNSDFNLYGTTNDITLYVSSPKLECMSICGNGSITSRGTLNVDTLQLGVMGTGELKLDTVRCGALSLLSAATGNVSIAHLQGREASILSRSSATITADVDLKRLTVSNDGTQAISLRGHAGEVYIRNTKDKKLDISKLK